MAVNLTVSDPFCPLAFQPAQEIDLTSPDYQLCENSGKHFLLRTGAEHSRAAIFLLPATPAAGETANGQPGISAVILRLRK
ncbi:MAG: hypothetical protein ACM32E_28310 [Gemmatimonadota bacterium]